MKWNYPTYIRPPHAVELECLACETPTRNRVKVNDTPGARFAPLCELCHDSFRDQIDEHNELEPDVS